ncbi:hypothetical protein ACLOJK_009801 [Asimina triloba]
MPATPPMHAPIQEREQVNPSNLSTAPLIVHQPRIQVAQAPPLQYDHYEKVDAREWDTRIDDLTAPLARLDDKLTRMVRAMIARLRETMTGQDQMNVVSQNCSPKIAGYLMVHC